MKRFAPVLLVLAGWMVSQIAGTPQQAYAQARTSLASLQTAIDAIISGNATVGNAANLDGRPSSAYVRLANVNEAANASNVGALRLNGTNLQFNDGTGWQTLLTSNAASQTYLPRSGGTLTGNLTVSGSIAAGGSISGSGSGLTSVPAGSLSGTSLPGAIINQLDLRYVTR
jgi:hypothetical protein